MSRQVPEVTWAWEVEDRAHYKACIALDDVLGWFRDDGYVMRDLLELVEAHVEDTYLD